MAVFVSASDETAGGGGLFQICGYVAPEGDWWGKFAPQWEDEILNAYPPIPYLHMTDMRSKQFREQHHLCEEQAERKVDKACEIIHNLPSLEPIRSAADADFIQREIRRYRMKIEGMSATSVDADYICFLAYVPLVLRWVKQEHPEASKVDFIVEMKNVVTRYLQNFHENMPTMLRDVYPEVEHLLGQLIPGDKYRVPLQAADVLCWHTQRVRSLKKNKDDAQRYALIANRPGSAHTWTNQDLLQFAINCDGALKQNEEQQGISKVRQHDGSPVESSAQRDKSQAGRGEARESSKKAEG